MMSCCDTIYTPVDKKCLPVFFFDQRGQTPLDLSQISCQRGLSPLDLPQISCRRGLSPLVLSKFHAEGVCPPWFCPKFRG